MSDAASEGIEGGTKGRVEPGSGSGPKVGTGPRPSPTPRPASALCPYCGEVSRDMTRCSACGGPFDPLSRQATQNAMGPWFVRDSARPFRPGCSFSELRRGVERGRIGPETVVRGPTTHQFWAPARRVPGLANLLGMCHACGGEASPKDYVCSRCGVAFPSPADRQHLGLIDTRPLPGRDRPEAIVSEASPVSGTPRERWSANRVVYETPSIDAEGVTLSIGRRKRRSALWPVAALAACTLVVGVGLGVAIGRLPTLMHEGVGAGSPLASGKEPARAADRSARAGDEGVSPSVRRSTETGVLEVAVEEAAASRVEPGETVVGAGVGSGEEGVAWSERIYGLLLEDSLGSVATARELMRREGRNGREHAISARAEGYVDRRFQVVRIRTLP